MCIVQLTDLIEQRREPSGEKLRTEQYFDNCQYDFAKGFN